MVRRRAPRRYTGRVPELLEVERYRQLASSALGRAIVDVRDVDRLLLADGLTTGGLRRALRGRRFIAARRIGKLLLLDTDGGSTLGVHFGMTGILEVDGTRAIEHLQHASRRRDPRWVRLAVMFADGGALALHDQRRLGAISLDPDTSRLGPDAMSVSGGALRRVMAEGRAPIKARLLDQRRLAGLGNLLVDEILWRAGLDPARPGWTLTPAEHRRLHRHLRQALLELLARGGSHTGDLQAERRRAGRCPRDGALLERRVVGGRTTYSCPLHQR